MAACCTPVGAMVEEEARKQHSKHTQSLPFGQVEQPSAPHTTWESPVKITQHVVTQECNGAGFALYCFIRISVRDGIPKLSRDSPYDHQKLLRLPRQTLTTTTLFPNDPTAKLPIRSLPISMQSLLNLGLAPKTVPVGSLRLPVAIATRSYSYIQLQNCCL